MVQQGFNEPFFCRSLEASCRHAHKSGLKLLFFFFFYFSHLLKEVCFSINVFAEGQGQNSDARCVCNFQ